MNTPLQVQGLVGAIEIYVYTYVICRQAYNAIFVKCFMRIYYIRNFILCLNGPYYEQFV